MLLPVSAPFHCAMLEPASERLAAVLAEVAVETPCVPVYLNVDGEAETDGAAIREKLVMQAKSPVYWEKTLRNMYRDGVRVFIELGPGKTLSGFVRKTLKEYPDVKIFHVSDAASLRDTEAGTAGRNK